MRQKACGEDRKMHRSSNLLPKSSESRRAAICIWLLYQLEKVGAHQHIGLAALVVVKPLDVEFLLYAFSACMHP